jgi:hypothetical protein
MSARLAAPDDLQAYSSFLELVNRYQENVIDGALRSRCLWRQRKGYFVQKSIYNGLAAA